MKKIASVIFRVLFLPSVLLLGIGYCARANVWLPQIFSDNMVLQQNGPVLWGKADAGEKVEVTVGKQKTSVVAGGDGRWRVRFASLKAGESTEMVVKGKNKITVRNVLIGDVWVGSGQSNMVWQLKLMEHADSEIAAANYPRLRLFTVKNIGSAYTSQDDLVGQWIACSPKTAGEFSATLYFFGINLYQELQYPLGLIVDAWSGSRIQSWVPLDLLRTDPQTREEVDHKLAVLDDPEQLKKYNEEQLANWEKASADAAAKGIKAPGKPGVTKPLDKDRPGGLYNSMISPLSGLSVKGIVWYQGEFNASDAGQYARLLPMMITTWRKAWGSELPFVVIQLPNVNQTVPFPTESPWARLREAQLKALELAKTAVTVTLDTGDGELHPKTKRVLGERAARSALQLAYGQNREAEAPLYAGYRREGNSIRIFFKNTAGGLVIKGNGNVAGFTVAGGNYRFVNAQAKLDSNNSVLVWNNDISIPVAVRYAWAQNPVLSLYNKAGLPVSSFRTDRWPADRKGYQDDTAKKAVLNQLLNPDYIVAPLKEWEKEYSVFQFKVSEKGEHVLPYRLYQPVMQPGKKYPLVLLMHGAGERGFDNRLQLSRLKGLPFWEKNPCIVIAPQCPQKPADNTDGESVWVKTSFGAPSHSMHEQPTWPMQMTIELLKKVIAENPVDLSRIYVTGLSMGGFATWELIQRMPDVFAAAMPVCGGGDTALATKLVNIPLWVFHGDADPTVMVQRSSDMVKCIANAGGHPKYTEYPGVGHNAWSPTYNNPEVWDWLFAQKKREN